MIKMFICDICGGALTLVSGGMAVCDNCGAKYSKDYITEKAKIIKQNCKKSSEIDCQEYLRKAKIYLCEKSYKEALKFVNQVLQRDSSNWLAKLYKVMCEEKFYINPDDKSLEGKLNYYNYKNKDIRFPIVKEKILDIVKEIKVLNIDNNEKINIMNTLAACLCRAGVAKSNYYSKKYWDKCDSSREPTARETVDHYFEQFYSIAYIEEAMRLLEGMEDSLSMDNVFYMKEAICHIIEDITYDYAFGGDEKLIEKYKEYREFLFSIDNDADRNEVLNTAYVYKVDLRESYSSMRKKAVQYWKEYDRELLKNK